MRTPDEIKNDPNSKVPCGKCKGSGTYVAKTSGRGYSCSACYGSGNNFTKEAKKELKAAKEAELDAKREPLKAWVAALRVAAAPLKGFPPLAHDATHDEEMDYCEARDNMSFEEKQEARTRDMLESIADQAWNDGFVTDKQRAAADRILVKLAEPKKEKTPVPTGKVAITGTIVSIKEVPNPYAYNSSTLKMVVEDDRGFRVYGTLPSRLQYPCPRGEGGWIVEEDKEGNETWFRSPDKGDRCSFNANVEASNNDESFGFYKRPTKVKAL